MPKHRGGEESVKLSRGVMEDLRGSECLIVRSWRPARAIAMPCRQSPATAKAAGSRAGTKSSNGPTRTWRAGATRTSNRPIPNSDSTRAVGGLVCGVSLKVHARAGREAGPGARMRGEGIRLCRTLRPSGNSRRRNRMSCPGREESGQLVFNRGTSTAETQR
jgi:hypothetical protein